MSALKIGALFAGYGGLDLAVQQVWPDAEMAWYSEIDKGALKILGHRFPDVPNVGDVTTVDWSSVEPVDVLTGGYPCQPFSHAGRRQGVEDERHLWPHVATAIGNLRPSLVVFENVRGHLTLGFDEVLRDLSLLHYRLGWMVLRAADIGAPHGRARIFMVGRNDGRQLRGRTDRRGGLHRDRGGRRLDAVAAQGVDDGQGVAGAASDGVPLWGQGWPRPGGDADESRVAHLATEREARSGSDRPPRADAAGEVGGGASRPGVSVDGGQRRASAERLGELDRRDAPEGAGVPRTDQGSESAGTGPRPAAGDAVRCATARFLVRAGGRPVRAGGVRRSLPDLGADGGGQAIRPALSLLPTPSCSDTNGAGQHGDGWLDLRTAVALMPTPTTRDHKDHTIRREPHRPDDVDTLARALTGVPCALLPTPAVNDMGEGKTVEKWDEWTATMQAKHGNGNGHGGWGDYAAAIARWEHVLGRPAPAPTQTSKKGNPQLSARFVEWLMGLPEGWVTDVPGITRNEALKALGNGVVPQQAAEALRLMLTWEVAA